MVEADQGRVSLLPACGGDRVVRWISLVVLCVSGSATALWAQTGAATPRVLASSTQASSAPAAWAPRAPFVASDTIRNITGYLIQGEDATPATCLAAVQLARTELDRRPYRDTLPPTVRLASDTLPTAVQTVGARCWAAVSTSAGVTQDPQTVLALALQLGDSSLAATTVARWVASPAQQPTDRNETSLAIHYKRLATAMALALDRTASALSFATTVTFVQSLVRQMETLGAPVRKAVMNWRATFVLWQLDHAVRLGQWQPAQTTTLVLNFLRQSDAAAPADRPGLTQRYYLLTALLRARAFADPHGVMAFYDSLCNASPTVKEFNDAHIGTTQKQVGPALRASLLVPLAAVGDTVPPLQGTYWYHAAQATATGNTWPITGHVSLLVRLEGELNLRTAAMLRRLAAHYGPDGLSITLVTKTRGYWLKDGTHTGPVSPAQEAVDDSAYYLDYLHLPVTLVVVPSTFRRDSEHRLRQAASVQYEADYDQRRNPPAMILVDRAGHVILRDVIEDEWSRFQHDNVENEGRLAAYIARVVERTQPAR